MKLKLMASVKRPEPIRRAAAFYTVREIMICKNENAVVMHTLVVPWNRQQTVQDHTG
jgi:hypothetical protein